LVEGFGNPEAADGLPARGAAALALDFAAALATVLTDFVAAFLAAFFFFTSFFTSFFSSTLGASLAGATGAAGACAKTDVVKRKTKPMTNNAKRFILNYLLKFFDFAITYLQSAYHNDIHRVIIN
jgi:hypothetical protein